ncbi:hypothetical protein [Nonomuraea africana]|uniref:Uncharacterized protein n=1 Tax=Nonomuraea africana TaxID=46171 RepID=A0ABR9K818_9ACTN|nr:hypothetical protein [Nonomuraea africana]MBE1558156.1 hypothetical protein [Nonomuraea africana]
MVIPSPGPIGWATPAEAQEEPRRRQRRAAVPEEPEARSHGLQSAE